MVPIGPGGELLLGRALELEAIDRALEAASDGRGALLLVAGEPGIGKTRLADVFEQRARARDFSVHWGRVWETGGAPAYWPWSQILGAIADEPDLVTAGTREALAPILTAGGAGPLADAAQARFRLFEGAASLLRAAAARTPRALVLDDVHAADPSSLELLQFVARALRGLRVVLLVTYRDVEARLQAASRDALGRVAREGTLLPLRRLQAEEVAQLVGSRLPGAPASLVEGVQRLTEGNPLFVDEVVRQLAAAPDGLRRDDLARLPVTEGMRLVIADRLSLLSPDARAVLDAAAILGREVRLDLLVEITGRPRDAVAAGLDALAAAEIVGARDGDRCVFRHALFHEAPAAALSAERRAALHLAAADALERCAGPSDDPLAAVAHHLLAARPAAPEARVIGAVLRAAQRASQMLAHEEAARWAERGLEVIDTGLAADAARGALLIAKAEALALGEQLTPARDAALAAAELARRLRDTDLLCRAALAYGLVFQPGVVDPVRVDLLREALAAVGTVESATHARLLARLAAALQPSSTPDEPIAMALEAVAMARRVGDPAALLAVLRSAASAMADTADPADRLPIDVELVQMAVQAREPTLELRARIFLVLDHFEAGDVALARLRLDECARLAAAPEHARQRWRLPLLRSGLAIVAGQFADADRAFEQATALAADAAEAMAPLHLDLHRVGRLILQGRFPEARALLPTDRSLPGWSTMFEAFNAFIDVRSGDMHAARARLALVPPEAFEHGDPLQSTLLGYCAGALGHPAAADLYARLQAYAQRLTTWGLIGSYMEVPGHAFLGRLAFRLGRHDECRKHFDAALALIVSARARAFEAWVRFEYGEVLLAMGDPARAGEELAAAAAIARELDIATLPERAQSQLEGSATATAPTPAEPAPPSPPPLAAAVSFELRPSGDTWTIERGGRAFHLKDSRGMQILARLVAEPGRELHCTELAATDAGPSDLGDAGELLDREAKAAYRRRLEELREDLEEAEARNDVGRAERMREEMDALTRELARAVGLGGRDRRAGAAAERARTAVQRRVREAVRKIAEHDPELGRHLGWAIKTGAFCSYDPDGRLR